MRDGKTELLTSAEVISLEDEGISIDYTKQVAKPMPQSISPVSVEHASPRPMGQARGQRHIPWALGWRGESQGIPDLSQ